MRGIGCEMQGTPPSTDPEKPSLLSPGTGCIQDVHLGQVMFRPHSCHALLLLRPSCSPARQIHPCCPRTNESIHVEAPRHKLGGGRYSTNVCEGSGEWVSGAAILFHAQHSQPLSHSPRFHWQVTGDHHERGS